MVKDSKNLPQPLGGDINTNMKICDYMLMYGIIVAACCFAMVALIIVAMLFFFPVPPSSKTTESISSSSKVSQVLDSPV